MKIILFLYVVITFIKQSEQKFKSPIKYESCVDAIKEQFADWRNNRNYDNRPDEFVPACDVYGGYKMEQRLYKGEITKCFCVNPRNGALLVGPGDRKNINCSKYVENCKEVKKDERNENQPPQCDQNGKWKEKQMLKNKSHFCVEKNTGTKISCDKNCNKNNGTATVMKIDAWSRNKNLKCDEYGNYKVQQDDGHGVWCADPETGATMKTSRMRAICVPEDFVEEAYDEYEILPKDPNASNETNP